MMRGRLEGEKKEAREVVEGMGEEGRRRTRWWGAWRAGRVWERVVKVDVEVLEMADDDEMSGETVNSAEKKREGTRRNQLSRRCQRNEEDKLTSSD